MSRHSGKIVKKEHGSDQYDAVYASGAAVAYELPYWRSGYLPLYKEVARRVMSRKSDVVLEVGCGTGGFANLLVDKTTSIEYHGFDFSSVAVERAKRRTKRSELFSVGDARSATSYLHEYDAIVCTEVLEHIEMDREVIANWRVGTYCVCSVPNFDADDHVRWFKNEDQVRSRYGSLIEIENVLRIKKPVLVDISWRNYLRELRWNRYRPARLLAILGLASFHSVGGWFVFSGKRR